MVSHALGLWDGRNDPFANLTGLTTLGTIGVAIFFAISGYWVTASWQNARSLEVFAANRGAAACFQRSSPASSRRSSCSGRR